MSIVRGVLADEEEERGRRRASGRVVLEAEKGAVLREGGFFLLVEDGSSLCFEKERVPLWLLEARRGEGNGRREGSEGTRARQKDRRARVHEGQGDIT